MTDKKNWNNLTRSGKSGRINKVFMEMAMTGKGTSIDNIVLKFHEYQDGKPKDESILEDIRDRLVSLGSYVEKSELLW